MIRTYGQMGASVATRQIQSKKLHASPVILLQQTSWLSVFFCPRSSRPESLFFQSLEEQKKPKHSSDSSLEVVPITPDVDLLLQCSFSYMRQGEERASQEQQLCEKPEETFLDPTGPEEDKEEVGFLTLWWRFESLPFKKQKIAVTQVILKLNTTQQKPKCSEKKWPLYSSVQWLLALIRMEFTTSTRTHLYYQ